MVERVLMQKQASRDLLESKELAEMKVGRLREEKVYTAVAVHGLCMSNIVLLCGLTGAITSHGCRVTKDQFEAHLRLADMTEHKVKASERALAEREWQCKQMDAVIEQVRQAIAAWLPSLDIVGSAAVQSSPHRSNLYSSRPQMIRSTFKRKQMRSSSVGA